MSDTMSGAGIYAQANKPSVAMLSPMDAMAQAGQVAQTINANRLFQAQQARGQILQQAVDPATGQVDPAKANRLLAQRPDAALMAPEAIQQSQGLQGQQQQQATQRFGWISNAAGSLMSDNNGAGPTFARLQQTLAAGVQGGYIQQSDAQSLIAGMPQGDDARSMATRLHMIETVNEQLQSSQQRLSNAGGDAGTINTGGGTQGVVTGGRLGGRYGSITPTAGYVPNTLTPGEATTRDTVYDQSGNPISAPRSATVDPRVLPPQLQNAPASGGRYPGAAQPQAPAAPAGPNDIDPSLSMPVGGSQPSVKGTSVPPAIPGAGGTAYAGPAPGTAQRNEADTALYTKDLNNVQNGNARVQTLQEAQAAIRDAKTGKGSGGLQTIISAINTFNPDLAKSLGSATGTDAEKYDLAKKYLTDYMRSSGSAGQSDAQLAAAAGSNASVDITNQAAQHVISLQIGRERQQMAQVQEFPAEKNGVGYGQQAAQFSSKTDPRGFSWDTYTPEQQQQILAGVKGNKTSSDRLIRSIGMAKRLGMIAAPGQ